MSSHILGAKLVTLNQASNIVPAGYIQQVDLVTVDPQLSAPNIRSGANLFGITGTATVGPWNVKGTGQTMSYTPNDDPYYQPAGQQPSYAWFDAPYENLVVDNRTGLCWYRYPGTSDGSSTCSWATALSRAEANTMQDYTDWRLPNINELMTIMEWYFTYGNAVNPTYFPGSGWSGLECWSSTTCVNNTAYAWVAQFGGGYCQPRTLKTVSDTTQCWPVRNAW